MYFTRFIKFYLILGFYASILYLSFYHIRVITQTHKERLRHRDGSQHSWQQTHVIPTIYFVTPTYARVTQKADLTRLFQTLQLVPSLHLVLVEDSNRKSELVTRMLRESHVTYTHLNATKRVPLYKRMVHLTKGVHPRNKALEWLRIRLKGRTEKAVVYFGDDDNTYSLELFDQIRRTRKVSVWPVGFQGRLRYEGPICKHGKVIEWRSNYRDRTFMVDMAGFAINADMFLEHKNVYFRERPTEPTIESDFLLQFNLTMHDLEAMADNCTKVYVWHTRTVNPDITGEKRWRTDFTQYNNVLEI